MKRVLLIGGSGRVGRQVVAELSARQTEVRVLARNPSTMGFAPAVEIVPGDLTVPESLDAAFKGIDTVFLVWTAPPDTVRPVLERITKHTRKIVFLSSPYKTAHPFFQKPQPNPTAALHKEIEKIIESSGLEWTFLRPAIFAGNAVFWWAPQIRTGDLVHWPYLAARTAPIDERDIAAVAVRALCEGGHGGAEYVITGPESLTQLEQICTIGCALGRSLRTRELGPEVARTQLFGSWPVPVVDMLFNAWSAAIGQPALVTSTVADITGAPARIFRQWAQDHVAEFQV